MNGRRELVLANRRNSVRVNCVAQFRRMSRTMLPCRRSYTIISVRIGCILGLGVAAPHRTALHGIIPDTFLPYSLLVVHTSPRIKRSERH